jgi:hypothetical protein
MRKRKRRMRRMRRIRRIAQAAARNRIWGCKYLYLGPRFVQFTAKGLSSRLDAVA